MSRHNGGRVLAIGLDAAEPALIRRLIAQDEMPALKSLLAEGRWLRVQSPAHIGSGTVWPAFMTGKEPSGHGVYGEWCWQPETMSLFRFDGRILKPLSHGIGLFTSWYAPHGRRGSISSVTSLRKRIRALS
ncbi:MAG TPA: alkaline phosphatase family protein [Pyrinomonadaceae bacterium]|jgi:predicted AlkP superfamily phosphohydrolase/phosphomutase